MRMSCPQARIRAFYFCAVMVILSVATSHAQTDNYGLWLANQNIILNTTPSGANTSTLVTKFPVLIRLNPSTFSDFSNIHGPGMDVRFSKADGTHLAYSIERWNGTNDTAEIWVLADTILPNNNTQSIKMYWNYASAADSSKPGIVFDTLAGYMGVWHLNDTLDATNNGFTVSNFSAMPGPGLIGKAYSFNGSSNYMNAGMSKKLNPQSNFSLSAWINASSFAAMPQFLSRGTSQAYELGIGTGGTIKANAKINAVWKLDSSITPISPGTWHYVAVQYNGSYLSTYLDGSLSHQTSATGMADTITMNTFIGKGYGSNFFSGMIDEVRIQSLAPSADWVKLCFENQKPNQTLVQPPSENYATWTYNQSIVMNTMANGVPIGGNVNNFPVLVRLRPDNFNFGQAASDGSDIRFAKADGITPLSYEIESWDNAGQKAFVWVHTDTILASNNTQNFKMFWGKGGAINHSNPPMVFDSGIGGFKGVWHLNEDSTGAGWQNVYKDATICGHNLDDFVGSSNKIGIVGKGQGFNGASDYIGGDTLFKPQMIPKQGTVSLWLNTDTAGITQEFFGGNINYMLKIGPDSTIKNCLGTSGALTGRQKILPKKWYLITATYDTAAMQLKTFINGAQDTFGPLTWSAPPYSPTYFGKSISTPNFKGMLDEVRVSRGVRSPDWVKLCYENERFNAKFLSIDHPDTIAPIISATGPANNAFVNNKNVSYTLSELVAAGAVTWTRIGGNADGGSPHVQPLMGGELASGTHTNISLSNPPSLVSNAIYNIDFNASDSAGNNAATVTSNNITFDVTSPTVTINQAGGQPDPAGGLPIDFAVTFSEAVSGFTTGSIVNTGTATGVTFSITGSGAMYTVSAVSVTTEGTIVPHITAGAAADAATNASLASTSTDNSVTYDTPPTVTINQAGGQVDPAASLPINFAVVFSKSVTGFTTGSIVNSGSATGVTFSISGTGANYTVSANAAATEGTIIPHINAGAGIDAAANASLASTSTDNSVTYDLPPTVTINQAGGQPDPTGSLPIEYVVLF
ncbi:MAG: DUF2341 domain-containing protein, partial [Chitinivibrionales bacterium]|nr:DUF2341 domain-containing protein [Chitinivibrionales bacterium]